MLAMKQAAPSTGNLKKSIYLTDDELLALFPEGSCFLAEVDGKKEQVFLDPEVQRQYVSEAGQQQTLDR